MTDSYVERLDKCATCNVVDCAERRCSLLSVFLLVEVVLQCVWDLLDDTAERVWRRLGSSLRAAQLPLPSSALLSLNAWMRVSESAGRGLPTSHRKQNVINRRRVVMCGPSKVAMCCLFIVSHQVSFVISAQSISAVICDPISSTAPASHSSSSLQLQSHSISH